MPRGISRSSGIAPARAAAIPASFSVQGQRYAVGGAALGGQFQVNTYSTSNQFLPSVASDAEGNFVVAWTSLGSSGGDTSTTASRASATPRRHRAGRGVPGRHLHHRQSACSVGRVDAGGISRWSGRATARAGAIPRPIASRASATPRGAPRWTGSPGQHLHHQRSAFSVGRVGCRGRFRGGLAERRLERGRHLRSSASRASATPQEAPRSEGSSRSTPTPPTISVLRRSRRMPRAISWWSGIATARAGRYLVRQRPRPALRRGGALLGGQFQVNTYTTSFQLFPRSRRKRRGISWWSG